MTNAEGCDNIDLLKSGIPHPGDPILRKLNTAGFLVHPAVCCRVIKRETSEILVQSRCCNGREALRNAIDESREGERFDEAGARRPARSP